MVSSTRTFRPKVFSQKVSGERSFTGHGFRLLDQHGSMIQTLWRVTYLLCTFSVGVSWRFLNKSCFKKANFFKNLLSFLPIHLQTSRSAKFRSSCDAAVCGKHFQMLSSGVSTTFQHGQFDDPDTLDRHQWAQFPTCIVSYGQWLETVARNWCVSRNRHNARHTPGLVWHCLEVWVIVGPTVTHRTP